MQRTANEPWLGDAGQFLRSRFGWGARLSLSVLVCLYCSVQANRNVVTLPSASDGQWGEYWALLIGINQYTELPTLKTAVADAQETKDCP